MSAKKRPRPKLTTHVLSDQYDAVIMGPANGVRAYLDHVDRLAGRAALADGQADEIESLNEALEGAAKEVTRLRAILRSVATIAERL